MEKGGRLYLLADFLHSGNLQPVTMLEDEYFDFETGYRLFFFACLSGLESVRRKS